MGNRKIKTRPWDVVEYLQTDEDIAAYLTAVLEDGTPAVIAAALGDIARAKGMAQIARDTGLGRESLYKALSAGGNPAFATFLSVLTALGLKLSVQPAAAPKKVAAKGKKAAKAPARVAA